MPERFAVEVEGLTMHDLTEQQAWEMFLFECGQTRLAEVKMHQGDRIVVVRNRKHDLRAGVA